MLGVGDASGAGAAAGEQAWSAATGGAQDTYR